MKLKGKILSVLLAVLLCCTVLPVVSAEETVPEYLLDTVAEYESFTTAMTLRATKRPETNVTLTITYDPEKVVLMGASGGYLYNIDEFLAIQIEADDSTDGNIQLELTPDSFNGSGILAYFVFGAPESLTEDITIQLEAKTADGTSIPTQDGRIRPMDADYSMTSADTNDKILPMFFLGTAVGMHDNITLAEAKQLLSPAEGCTFDAYAPDGSLLTDNDLLGTGCFLRSTKDNVVVSQAAFTIYGDVNGDGKADAGDALMVLQHSVQLIELNEFQTAAANCFLDFSDDTTALKIDATDALTILQYSVGLIPMCLAGSDITIQ